MIEIGGLEVRGLSSRNLAHAIFQWDRWWYHRREVENSIGSQLEPETMVSHMLQY